MAILAQMSYNNRQLNANERMVFDVPAPVLITRKVSSKMTNSDSTPRTIEIPLTKGFVAIVDEQDADLAAYKWHAYIGKLGNVYARRARHKGENGNKNIHLHRIVLERVLNRVLEYREKVDHHNNDGLDNTRGNLRLASPVQNARNRRIVNNETGYKGINRDKRSLKWQARIVFNNKRISLGYFNSKEDAACVYNYYAVRYFGEFARVNEIGDWQSKAERALRDLHSELLP